jgi:hypothetical protein
MTWWPGWKSIEGASRGETFFWWLGISCLILLATSEIISHRYGQRKDELAAAARRATLVGPSAQRVEILEQSRASDLGGQRP